MASATFCELDKCKELKKRSVPELLLLVNSKLLLLYPAFLRASLILQRLLQ